MVTRTEGFLFAANIMVIVLAPIDVAYLAGMIQLDPISLTLINLVVLGISFLSFRIKKSIRISKMKASAPKPEA